jgi:hypothetical protein
MFYRIRQNQPQEWVVLKLSPKILWKLDCSFYASNAASTEMRHLGIEECRKFEALRGMFQDFSAIQRMNLNIPDYYTTNPQAEVLVFNSIHKEFITQVCFSSESAMVKWLSKNPGFEENLICLDSSIFEGRCDNRFWKKDQSQETFLEFGNEEIPF